MPEDRPDDVDRRLYDIEVQLAVVRTVMATTTAITLQSANEERRRQILKELRQNVLLTMMTIDPSADPATQLVREESVDQFLDTIVRFSRQPPVTGA